MELTWAEALPQVRVGDLADAGPGDDGLQAGQGLEEDDGGGEGADVATGGVADEVGGQGEHREERGEAEGGRRHGAELSGPQEGAISTVMVPRERPGLHGLLVAPAVALRGEGQEARLLDLRTHREQAQAEVGACQADPGDVHIRSVQRRPACVIMQAHNEPFLIKLLEPFSYKGRWA